MKPSLVELVDVIIRRIQEKPEAAPSEKGLRSWLTRQGYNQREIDAALNLVRPRFRTSPYGSDENPITVRLLSPVEESKLTVEARNALVRLELYGMIDGYEREMILDYTNHFEGVVGLDELDYLLSWIVCSCHDVGYQETLFHVFEGKEHRLH
jgi:uncharacterized protein Smg (DUF494 family)